MKAPITDLSNHPYTSLVGGSEYQNSEPPVVLNPDADPWACIAWCWAEVSLALELCGAAQLDEDRQMAALVINVEERLTGVEAVLRNVGRRLCPDSNPAENAASNPPEVPMPAPTTRCRCSTVEKLRDTVNVMDCLSQGGFSEIAAIASLALRSLENSEGYRNRDDIAAAFAAIRGKAQDIGNCINSEAESVGCNYTNDAERRRWAAERTFKDKVNRPVQNMEAGL